MLAIYKRELKSYFYSPTAYALIGLYILLLSVLYSFYLSNGIPNVHELFSGLAIIVVLCIITSILTMKVFSEDRKGGTEVLLVTSPIKTTKIILGKYFAALSVHFVLVIITFVYPLVLSFYGDLPTANIIVSYIGFFLLGAVFISIGIFASSLTENQVIAAVISFIVLLVFTIVGEVARSLGGSLSKFLNWFSPFSRLDTFTKGILDFGPIIYYLTFIFVFLFFTALVLEKRRWSQG